MSENKEEGYGSVSYYDENYIKHEHKIVDHIQARYVDNRLITIAGVDDGTTILSVENPESTGRAKTSQMRLSRESMVGLLSTVMLYYDAKGINLQKELEETAVGGKIEYSVTDNLKHPFEDGGSNGIDKAVPSNPEQ
jgi:hypothetical protein